MPCTIITGGGRGIGLAVAQHLLDSDPLARCALIDLDFDEAEDLRERYGPERVLAIVANVTDREAAFAAADAIRDWAEEVAGLVTAAGIAREHASADLTADDLHDVFDVHLAGTLYWCQAGYDLMGERGGAIVCISSVVARLGHPRRLPYATAKAAVEELVRTLAVEWAESDVRVNAVAPGYVATRMVRRLEEQGTIDLEAIARAHLVGRLAEPREIAAPIAFLLSPAASFITGTVLTVDGGYSTVKSVTDLSRATAERPAAERSP